MNVFDSLSLCLPSREHRSGSLRAPLRGLSVCWSWLLLIRERSLELKKNSVISTKGRDMLFWGKLLIVLARPIISCLRYCKPHRVRSGCCSTHPGAHGWLQLSLFWKLSFFKSCFLSFSVSLSLSRDLSLFLSETKSIGWKKWDLTTRKFFQEQLLAAILEGPQRSPFQLRRNCSKEANSMPFCSSHLQSLWRYLNSWCFQCGT